MSNLLFVYGTLKRNFYNHFFIKNCKFIGEGYTIDKFRMFDKDYPYIVFDNNGFSIKGEIYEITNKVLWNKLDELEDYPDEYDKTIIKVHSNSQIFDTYIYFYPKYKEGIEITKIKFNNELKISFLEWIL